MTIDIEMKLIKQIFERNKLENIEQNIKKELSNLNIGKKIKPGMRIGITAGSRGIDRINLILKTISDEIKKYEGIPVVIACMGSHGGATKKGQLEILRHYRIIEENIGAPIIATDKSFVIGYLENGLPVYVNDLVKSLDAILVVNRIKVHTSFKAPIESGLNKMTAIGLGHHKGASLIHSLGIENLHRNILRFSNRILKELPIIGGIGLL
jgi:nickel-dependent lactate racemase